MPKYTHSVPKRTDVYDTTTPRPRPTRIGPKQLLAELDAGIRYFWNNPKRDRRAAARLKVLQRRQRRGSDRYSLNSVEGAEAHNFLFNP